MHEKTLRIERVDACPCGAHALVRLVDEDGRLRAQLRIGVEAGRSLSAFDAGLPDAMTTAGRTLERCLRAVGARPVALLLSDAGERVEASMWLTAADGAHIQTVIDPGFAMVAARVLELPIGVQSREASPEFATARAALPIPEVYHGLLEHLRWDDLA